MATTRTKKKSVEELKQLDEKRRHYVIKSNILIQRSRYSLPINAQKLILYIISCLRIKDKPDDIFEFTITEFCDICGLDIDKSGMYYTRVKQTINELGNSQGFIKVIDENGKVWDKPFTWLSHDKTAISKGSGTIKIGFSAVIQPFIFDLHERFTKFAFVEVAKMRSKYSIRLYQLLRSYAWGKSFEEDAVEQAFTVQDLRQSMDAQSYDRYYNFKKRALIPAIQEINQCSSQIHIEYEEIKHGNTVKSILLEISKPRTRQLLTARHETNKRLDGMPY